MPRITSYNVCYTKLLRAAVQGAPPSVGSSPAAAGSECLIGGSQREDDTERLFEKVRHHELPEEEFQWYLDCRP